MTSGITVQCVYCKSRRILSLDEARHLDWPPMCEKDGGPMIAVAAAAKGKQK